MEGPIQAVQEAYTFFVDAIDGLPQLLAAGLRFSLELLPDGTFMVRFGDYLNSPHTAKHSPNFEQSVALLLNLYSWFPQRA